MRVLLIDNTKGSGSRVEWIDNLDEGTDIGGFFLLVMPPNYKIDEHFIRVVGATKEAHRFFVLCDGDRVSISPKCNSPTTWSGLDKAKAKALLEKQGAKCSDYEPKEEAHPATHDCYCDMQQLLRSGCRCGGK